MKNIRNLSLFFILLAFVIVPIHNAEAVIPFEISIPETAGKVTNWVQDKIAFVQQKIKIVTESKVGKAIGQGIKGIKKGVEWVKNAVKDAKEWSANTKDLIVNSKEYQIIVLTRAITEDAIRLSHLEEEREYRVREIVEDAQMRLEMLEEKIRIAREDLEIMKAEHERINEPKEKTEARAAELEQQIRETRAKLEEYQREYERLQSQEENPSSSDDRSSNYSPAIEDDSLNHLSSEELSGNNLASSGNNIIRSSDIRLSSRSRMIESLEYLIQSTEQRLAELESDYAAILQELEDKTIIRESYGSTYEVDYDKSYEKQDLYNATREEERQLMLQIEQMELELAQFVPFDLPVPTLGFSSARLDLPAIGEIIRLDAQYTNDVAETLKRHKENIEKVAALKWAWQHKEEDKTPLEIVSQAQEKYAADVNTADTIEASLKRQENIEEDITAATITGINTSNQYIAAFNDPENDATVNLGLSSTAEGKSEDLYPAIENTIMQIDLIRFVVQMEIEALETEVLEVIMHNINRKVALRKYSEDGALIVDICNYDIGREERIRKEAGKDDSGSSEGIGASNNLNE